MNIRSIVTIRMPRRRAIEQGLLVCKCGYPQNNHFNYTGGCAHNTTCKKYEEKAKYGVLV